MYEVNDFVNVAEENSSYAAIIVKICEDDHRNVIYCLMREDNEFVYKMNDTLSAISAVSGGSLNKRRKIDDDQKSNASTESSATSGSSWFGKSQMENYHINIEDCNNFETFFESEIPGTVPEEFKEIENLLDWKEEAEENQSRAIKKYKALVDKFEYYKSEIA